MATLLFNSNYLYVLLPSEAQSAALYHAGATFTLRCAYSYWPVSNLLQEWGVDDFPPLTAKWVASFFASPAPNNFANVENPRINDGELYWITLHPTKPPNEPVAVLCFADADRFFFGVATDREETAPLFIHSKSNDAEAWLQVVIENIMRIKTDETGEEEITAHLAIQGEATAGWAKAIVEPISV